MKFSIAYEMQRPTLDDHAVIEETLEQVILMDEMGWDYVWFVEHHFLTGFSMSPCPEVMFGALSRLTKRIRLGFGVVILPYRHPIRVAERIAMLDHMSHGRIDFGTGRSAPYEQTGMGIDPRDTREMWEESLAMIPKIWESDMFEWEGRFWKVPPRQVLPKPYQKPHPPIWMAALQPSSYELAAKKGIGVMALGVAAPSVMEPYVRKYKEDIKLAEPVGGFVNNQWQTSVMGYCGEDDLQAKELCAQSLKTFFGPDKPYLEGQKDVYQKLVEQWGGVPDHLKQNFSRYVTKVEDDATGEVREALDLSGGAARQAVAQMDAQTLCDRGVIIAGDPESCIKAIKLHEAAGVDQVHLLMATETIDHKHAMKSIELFGKYVIPEFKKAEEPAGSVR
jgi:alkanesulfonate monooxygenase SsuD/methylene tetrahydromethanopterin reductase-like flavin-dependent oxidoreductase (luciferase family)